MTTTTTADPTHTRPVAPSRSPASLSGAGLVAAVLVGNTLTEVGTSSAVAVGLALELTGFVLLLLFASTVAGRCGSGDAARMVMLGGGVAAAVKLASGALVLGPMQRPGTPDAVVAALEAANDAAFVLFWIGFGILVAAGARGLGAAGSVGPALAAGGQLVGVACVVAGILGSVLASEPVPVPFLLCLLWTVAASVRLALGPRRTDFGAPATS